MKNFDLLRFINQMGYVESAELYGDIAKLAGKRHHDITLKKIINQAVFKLMNNEDQIANHWEYTCRFAGDLNFGLIKNNSYFLEVLKNGMLEPNTGYHNKKVRLVSDNISNNTYTFIRSFRPQKDKQILIDYVLMINKLPCVLVIDLEKKNTGAEEVFDCLIDNGDRYKNFFNFCKYILIIEKERVYLGDFYRFFEDCLKFSINEKEGTYTQKEISHYICAEDLTKTLLTGKDLPKPPGKETVMMESFMTKKMKMI